MELEEKTLSKYSCPDCRCSLLIQRYEVYWNPFHGRGPNFPETNGIEVKYCPICKGEMNKLDLEGWDKFVAVGIHGKERHRLFEQE